MTTLYDQLSGELFDTLKGFGYLLSIYDDKGNRIFAPTKARRIFCQPDKMMISLDKNGDDSEVKMYLSKDTTIKSKEKLISTLRNLCTRYNVLFNVRKYGKYLSPKDFAYRSIPTNESNETLFDSLLEASWGSIKTSYQKIGEVKIVIKHSSPIDESKKGSRSRHIKGIFLEYKGERFRILPNLQGARALAQNLNQGGSLNDDMGIYIEDLINEMLSLNSIFKRNKSSLLENKGIQYVIMDRIKNISTELNKLSRPRRFSEMKRTFKKPVEEDISVLARKIQEELNIDESDAKKVAKASTMSKPCRVKITNESIRKELIDVLENEYGFQNGKDFIVDDQIIRMKKPVAMEAKSYINEFHNPKKECNIKVKKDSLPTLEKKLEKIGAIYGTHYTVSPFGNVIVKNPENAQAIRDYLYKIGAAFSDHISEVTNVDNEEAETVDDDLNKEAEDESHLNISFPFDGDDKVAKVLSAYFDDLNVLNNNVNDGRRNMVFNIPQDVDATGYVEKATKLLDGMGVQDTEVSMTGRSETVGYEDSEQMNEFMGDESDWEEKEERPDFDIGEMISTPMGPGTVEEIDNDNIMVRMMNDKVKSFHISDVDKLTETVSREIDEWFAQFNMDSIFEDEDAMDSDDSDADEDSMDSDDSDLDGTAEDAADSADAEDDLDEAFSDDPVGDADRYYGSRYDAQERVDSMLDKASDDFNSDEFIKIYGDDFGMENINDGEPEDYTVSDEEVIDSIAHYLTRLTNRYGDEDVSQEDAKPYAEDIFKTLKPELERKGLIFTQNETTLPRNVQRDFRKDISNGLDPALERMKHLAGLK